MDGDTCQSNKRHLLLTSLKFEFSDLTQGLKHFGIGSLSMKGGMYVTVSTGHNIERRRVYL